MELENIEQEMSDYINFTIPSNTTNILNTSDGVQPIDQQLTSNIEPQYIILGDIQTPNEQPSNIVTELQTVNKDDDILNILTAWKLTQLYTTLLENEIDVDALKGMQETHVEELLKNESLGIKIKFLQNLTNWQRLQLQSSTKSQIISCCSNSTNLDQPSSSCQEYRNRTVEISENIRLTHILQQTNPGRSLLSISENNRILSDASRSILVDEIVTHYINNSLPMGVNQCESMAAEIECHFPSENALVYFQRRKNRKSKGQLYDRYNNRVSKLRNSSLIPKPKRFKQPEVADIENNTNVLNLDDNARVLCENLKYNRDDTNLEDIFAKWTTSASYRMKWIINIKDINIDSIIKEWPAYSQTYGPRLIEIDFLQKYPDAESIFIKFDRFCNNILPIMETKIIEPLSKQRLKEYKQQKNVMPDARCSVILLLLHAIIKPTTKKKTAADQVMKFTIKDAQNSFMVLLPSTQAVDKHIQTQTKMALNNKSNLQPFIFIIGENLYTKNEYFVYCDSIRYKCVSALAAVDCAFKLFQVFCLEYPVQSKAVWQFIQSFFYNVSTKYDDAFPAVNLLISKLKN